MWKKQRKVYGNSQVGSEAEGYRKTILLNHLIFKKIVESWDHQT